MPTQPIPDGDTQLEPGVPAPQPDRPALRTITPRELHEALRAHRLWRRSEGREGRAADLSAADLKGADMRGAMLYGANLRATRLREADLRDADLRAAGGLLPEQLAGTDLSGAQLPEALVSFEGLVTVAEMSRIASMLFMFMLLGCAYVWLTIGATTDVELLTNSVSFQLPIIATQLPIVGFYWTAPIFLLGFYCYFHIFLQRLWEELAELPAVFPDGRPLDKKAYPWLLNDLVRAYVPRLMVQRPALFYLQKRLSILLAWWMVPVTLIALWLRFLPRHDWKGTIFHIIALVVTIGVAHLFHGLAAATLRGDPRRPFRWGTALRSRSTHTAAALASGIVLAFGLTSLGAIHGSKARFAIAEPPAWVPALLSVVGFSPFADFRESDVSTPSAGMTSQGALDGVRGARLSGRDLRFAEAEGAFLAKADLRHVRLAGAVLKGADLRAARLEFADLEGADVELADLSGANLYGARLREAGLNGARLRRATLSRADLEGASLYRADLRGADLEAANFTAASLHGADLRGADLRSPIGLIQAQLDTACSDQTTLLADGLRPAGQGCDGNELED